MFTAGKGRLVVIGAVVVGAAIALSGCASSNPLSSGSSSGPKSTIVIGSQTYYEDTTIAEIYAQALENGGYKVQRDFNIGQREVYLKQLKAGKIDLFPEYEGDLTQALNPKAVGGTADQTYAELKAALPSNLSVLNKAEASDGNSWTVTQAYAKKYNLTDLASLKNVTTPIYVGGNSELQTRPYGPKALESKYGVKIAGFKAVQDSSGPLTVKALVDNQVQLANIYTADPNIATNKLVALKDPDGLFLPDNIVPIVTKKIDKKAAAIINKVQADLSQSDLVSLNNESVNEKKSAPVIATAWLKSKGLLK
jgi:osmoprotectant transport system substrate-binding protein